MCRRYSRVEGILADPMLAAELRLAFLSSGRFLEQADNLLFAKLALFHDSTPCMPFAGYESNLSDASKFGEQTSSRPAALSRISVC